MTTIGDVLGLAHGAPDRVSTLRATAWHWHHHVRSERASRRYVDEHRGAAFHGGFGAGSQRATSRHVSQLWVEGRTRSRVERRVVTLGEREELLLTVIDGARRWTHIPGRGSYEGETGPGERFEYGWMFDPLPILAALGTTLAGDADVHGRPSILVAGPPRWSRSPLRLGMVPGADEYEAAIDAELGIVLRMTARIDGEPYAVTELRDLEIGIPLPPETWILDAPPGQKIVRIPPPSPRVSRRTWFTLGEVAADAPFAILIPSGVPADRGRATLVGRDHPTPAVAYLFYDLPPSLDLVERAVADAKPLEGFEPVRFDRLPAMVRRRRARHPAGRFEVRIERDGTECASARTWSWSG
jgi:hypothetical protein